MTASPRNSAAPMMGGGGLQLRAHTAPRHMEQGTASPAALDHGSGHDLKAESPQGLYTIRIKFRSFLVFVSTGSAQELLFRVRSGQPQPRRALGLGTLGLLIRFVLPTCCVVLRSYRWFPTQRTLLGQQLCGRWLFSRCYRPCTGVQLK